MTGFDHDDELLARLRAADPASSLRPAGPERTARLLEDTMSNATEELAESRATGTRGRGPLTWLVAAAAVLLIAGAGGFALLDRDPGPAHVPSAGGPRSVTHLSAPVGGTAGKCMVPNAQALGLQTLAFDGTVSAIDDDTVTLAPTHFYAGEPTDLVEVTAPAADLRLLVGAIAFEEGHRYLVSATDGRVTVCGFSAAYSPALAALYAEAFPG